MSLDYKIVITFRINLPKNIPIFVLYFDDLAGKNDR